MKRTMITDFFVPALYGIDVNDVWFQQDGTTCHTSHATIDVLRETFYGRFINRNDNVNWPPRSCDFTPLNYFLWSTVKAKCYVEIPETNKHLKANIRDNITDIRPQALEKLHENWTERMRYCENCGSYVNEIIFSF